MQSKYPQLKDTAIGLGVDFVKGSEDCTLIVGAFSIMCLGCEFSSGRVIIVLQKAKPRELGFTLTLLLPPSSSSFPPLFHLDLRTHCKKV